MEYLWLGPSHREHHSLVHKTKKRKIQKYPAFANGNVSTVLMQEEIAVQIAGRNWK
jgi:hypothetical protein